MTSTEQRKRILLIDDDEKTVEAIRSALAGYLTLYVIPRYRFPIEPFFIHWICPGSYCHAPRTSCGLPPAASAMSKR